VKSFGRACLRQPYRTAATLGIFTLGVVALILAPMSGAATAPSQTWASLGIIRPELVQPSGWGSPVSAQPTRSSFAWCSSKGVEVSTDGHATLVSDSSVGKMLKSSHLGLRELPSSSKVAVNCGNVALDPGHPNTVYASFQASEGGSIPPVYNVALVTTDLGRTWRFVPPPRGDSKVDFGGFIQQAAGVELLYSPGYFFPLEKGKSATFVTASSSTGGRTWTYSYLGCPVGAPCVSFGPEAPQGACGMSEWMQSVLVGSVTSTGITRWRAAGAIPAVSQCGNQQLITTSSGEEFLLDRSRANALSYTRDGVHWTNVALPKIEGSPVGGRFQYLEQAMTLDARGVLVAVEGEPSVNPQSLEVLEPGSKSWCTAKAMLPKATKQSPIAAIESTNSELVATFESPIPLDDGTKTMAISFPLSTLSCRS
jgi:hypothetical protein